MNLKSNLKSSAKLPETLYRKVLALFYHVERIGAEHKSAAGELRPIAVGIGRSEITRALNSHAGAVAVEGGSGVAADV